MRFPCDGSGATPLTADFDFRDATANPFVVDGTASADLIDGGYTDDPDGDLVDSNDHSDGSNNDVILAGAGNDTVYGGLGSDTIDGGDGDDLISGSDTPGSTGIGGTDTAGDTYTLISLGNFADTDPDETDTDAENAADLLGTHGGPGAELYNNFATMVAPDGNANTIVDSNDEGGTAEAFTIDGVTSFLDTSQVYNATVTFTDGTTGTFTAVVMQTTTGDVYLAPELGNNTDNILLTSQPIESITLDSIATASGNLTSDRVDADYQVPTESIDTSGDSIDGGAGNDTVQGLAGNDTLIGGTGNDSIIGGAGNDVITVAQGDVAEGGDGDDYFTLADLGEAGSGTIDITGGEGSETMGDTLQLTPDVAYADITFTNTDDAAGGLSGSFTMGDGTVVNFSEIENIICFTPGTLILTENGERAVETLRPGDRLITRDHGAQPLRWIGASLVSGLGDHAPVRVAPHMLDGARRPLLVSPQHRFLFSGYDSDLYFGQNEVFAAATHLEDGHNAWRAPCPRVTYIHLMLDRHEVIYAEGAATESFHAGTIGLSAISGAARDSLFAACPALRSDPGAHGPTARICLKAHEARMLMSTGTNLAMAA